MLKTSEGPRVTACMAVHLVLNRLVLTGCTILKNGNETLVKAMHPYKSEPLLEDICFQERFDSVTSKDILDALQNLLIWGLFQRLDYDTIILTSGQDEAAVVDKDFTPEDVAVADKIAADITRMYHGGNK